MQNPIAESMKQFLVNELNRTRGVQSPQVADAAKEEEQHPLLDVSGIIDGECTHQGHYRVTGSLHVAIRWCTGCGKSWRMPVQGDYIYGDHPVAEWEPIKEGLEVEERVLPDYEE